MLNKTGDTLHGFTVTRIRESEELSGRIVEMTYTQTGTELVWIDNHAENKLFSIAFKTLPEDSTGVFHILEHSVLCGSKKYPVREPFVELLKSSMSTFLNAMTFPDKTMYPVSSRNTRDFLNLTEVYLDAVFAPAILENPNIFYQEGWHIEQDENGTFSYKGVVFNEMKGALSSVDNLAEYKLLSLMFPDTCYGFNSGGDPAVIPSLTYGQFCENYRRFYHPSNARVFLDGDVPIDETLALLDEYLSQFQKSDVLPVLTMQTRKSATATQYFELSADEALENKSCLTVGRILCSWEERVKLIAIRILLDALTGSNESPIKRAVLSAGLAQELDISADDSIAQAYLMIHAKNVTDGRADEILPLIRKTAAELADSGLNYDALEASANRLAFQLLEPDEPQGLERCINCMGSWLYGGDPMSNIVYQDDFAAVRNMLAEKQFEQLLREVLVDDEGTAVLYSLPSYTRGDEMRQEEAARLDAVCSGWSESDLQANQELNRRLLDWQQTPDTPEQLATLPQLPLSAVSDEVSWTESIEQHTDGMTILYHPAPCKGIVHITLNFAMTDYSLEELSLLSHIGGFYGKLPTAEHSAFDLQQLLKSKLGAFVTAVDCFSRKDVYDVCTPVLAVSCSVLEDKLADAFALIPEVLLTTDFTLKEKISEILAQTNERLKQMSVMAGHALALTNTFSRYSARSAVGCALNGTPVIKATAALIRDYDTAFADFSALLQRVAQQTVCRRRLVYASVTAANETDILPLLRALPEGTAIAEHAAYSSSLPDRMGCTIPAQIGFAVQGWQIDRSRFRLNAGWRVAAKLISLSYLWNVVRVQGGAYGTGLAFQRGGAIYSYSYRDPSPAHSLEVNASISKFIRDFCESGEPLDKFIISAISDEEPLRTPRMAGSTADLFWFAGRTKEELVAERRQMLAVTRESLLDSCRVWDAFASEGAVCVCASADLLAACEDLTVTE
ncbi:MAG: insulinase family protein [Oscillospiraceae bacterium]|nr:insulinase family protein [Oscillospiraceae bacterium]